MKEKEPKIRKISEEEFMSYWLNMRNAFSEQATNNLLALQQLSETVKQIEEAKCLGMRVEYILNEDTKQVFTRIVPKGKMGF